LSGGYAPSPVSLLPTTPPAAAGSLAVTIVDADVAGINFGYNDEGALTGLVGTTTKDPVGDLDRQIETLIDDNSDTFDFGYATGSIGDRVWNDLDGNGAQDGGEPGINGVTVRLIDDNTGFVVDTRVTSGDGIYTFDKVPPGDYTVEVVPPAGFDPTFDLDGTLDDRTSLTLGVAEDLDDVDFGYRASTCLVIIDEETVDNDILTIEQAAWSHGVEPDYLVNDDRPTEVGNPPLRWNELFPGDVVLLPGGEVDDEGWFDLPEAIRYADDRTTDLSDEEWIQAFVDGTLPQDQLDKVRDVMPLRNPELLALVGRTCTAIVYDSDISINYVPLYANLQGARYGRFTFKVLAVEVPGSIPESQSSTSLYDLWLEVLPPAEPAANLVVPIHDHEPDSIQVTRARFNRRHGMLTVYGESNFAPPGGAHGAEMFLSVDGVDAGTDPAIDPSLLDQEMTFNPARGRYEFTLGGITENLKGRRLTIYTDEGGVDNVLVE
ncbi:MAG: hypothetical protein GY716_24435, partial [bacterium]|nr:hypothetical protein [bacterium]